ncbi:hypothetical protein [Thalassobacillus hwangdonensis]|uniref:Uncharacterized protein n=1 Tax=Thalassobacillus hwangdonensis TaxID=546108 RepID=A0ABW3KVY6_9BACI
MNVKIIGFTSFCIGVILIALLVVADHFPSFPGTIGNPTASEILNGNQDADIIKFEGLIYSNVTDHDWLPISDLKKGDMVGEIKKKTSSSWFFRNLYATKLAKGTELYLDEGDSYKKGNAPHYLIIVQEDKKQIYQSLREG